MLSLTPPISSSQSACLCSQSQLIVMFGLPMHNGAGKSTCRSRTRLNLKLQLHRQNSVRRLYRVSTPRSADHMPTDLRTSTNTQLPLSAEVRTPAPLIIASIDNTADNVKVIYIFTNLDLSKSANRHLRRQNYWLCISASNLIQWKTQIHDM